MTSLPAPGAPVSGDEAFGADLFGRLPGQGNLVFYWEDISGAFHEETVDTAANL